MILTAKELKGNHLMPHHRKFLFVKTTKSVHEITHSHAKHPDRFKALYESMKDGAIVPPPVIDFANVIMDGNNRLYAHKELGHEAIDVYQAIGYKF